MNCCCNQPTGVFFDKESKKSIKNYRKNGLGKVTKMMIEGIDELGNKDSTILDVGCGVGGAHRELLRKGASKAYATELSEEMLNAARELTIEEGWHDRVEFILGDIVAMNNEIPDVDITIHDKVVCCYEDADALIKKTLDKTKNIYGFIMPRNNLLVRISFGFSIFFSKLLRREFRPFFHPEHRILERIEKTGFKLRYENQTFIWKVRVYQKIIDDLLG